MIYLLSTTFIFLLGLLLECIALHLLMHNQSIIAITTHIIASITITLGCQLYIDRCFVETKKSFFAFLYGVCVVIPFFGALMCIFIAWSLDKMISAAQEHTETLETTLNLQEITPIEIQYGEGGVIRDLLNQNEDVKKRTKALFMLNHIQLSKVNHLIQKLLPEQADEMRLLAFSILEGQEDAISKRINELLPKLKQANLSSRKEAKIKKEIAEHYWELVYNHLLAQELENIIVEKAMSYAQLASKILTEDPSVWVLLGKIYKYSKDYDKAEKAFEKAMKLNIQPAQILPYLAEIKYMLKDYAGVIHYLSLSDTLLDIPQIAPTKLYWKPE